MKFHLLGVHEVDAAWPVIGPGLDVALRRSGGDMNLGQLYQGARSGASMVLIAHDDEAIRGAVVCRAGEMWMSGPKLRILAMYGQNFAKWQAEGWAAVRGLKEACGANGIVFEGRTGWERMPDARVIRQLYEVT